MHNHNKYSRTDIDLEEGLCHESVGINIIKSTNQRPNLVSKYIVCRKINIKIKKENVLKYLLHLG